MRDDVKSILYDLFQALIVVSIPVLLCFYWPNHDERLMKFIAFQVYTNILLCMCFLFQPKRIINNFYPALLFVLGYINLFTHNMSQYVSVGLGFIVPAVLSIYVISNHLHMDMVPVIKKTIVITCLLNCVLFIVELNKISVVFNLDLPSERPSGFMLYPANFALLCAISLFLAWEWRKWLCLPIGACLYLSHEFSVIAGVVLAVCVPFLNRWWHWAFIAGLTGFLTYHFWPDISGKLALRMRYLLPVFQNVWARPLDGWGVGEYNRLPDSFFGFPRGNWSEMHCEPLDLLFSFGLLGVAVVAGWIYQTVKEWQWTACSKCLIVIAVTSCFHSVLHFIDSLFLSIVVYSLWEIERNEQPDKRPAYIFGTTKDASRCCHTDKAFADVV